MSWADANDACAVWGGSLATVDGLRAQQIIEGIVDSSESFWIGMNNTKLTGLSQEWLKSADLAPRVPLHKTCLEWK